MLRCPFAGRKLFFLTVYWEFSFSVQFTIKLVGQDFYKFLDRLQKQVQIPEGMTFPQVINGFMMLWKRLGYPDTEQIYWMTVYQARHYDRQETVKILTISIDTFDKRIERLKQKAKITTLSER
jgi:hypothetical protein